MTPKTPKAKALRALKFIAGVLRGRQAIDGKDRTELVGWAEYAIYRVEQIQELKHYAHLDVDDPA